MQCTRAALILATIFLFSAIALSAEKGWFGLAVSVDIDGGLSLNPTLRSITVQKVLKVRRSTADIREVSLVAAPKPAGQ